MVEDLPGTIMTIRENIEKGVDGFLTPEHNDALGNICPGSGQIAVGVKITAAPTLKIPRVIAQCSKCSLGLAGMSDGLTTIFEYWVRSGYQPGEGRQKGR